MEKATSHTQRGNFWGRVLDGKRGLEYFLKMNTVRILNELSLNLLLRDIGCDVHEGNT